RGFRGAIPVRRKDFPMTQPGSGFGLGRIGQIAMTVQDLERAIAFYRDQLGMRFLFQAPPGLAFFDCDGIRLMLSVSEKPGETFSSILYFRVDQIESACETLAARGVGFEAKPHRIAQLPTHDLWMAFFRDPDRNLLALMSEVPRVA
ncbi:MAG: VOC family protein, partial [bacterium]